MSAYLPPGARPAPKPVAPQPAGLDDEHKPTAPDLAAIARLRAQLWECSYRAVPLLSANDPNPDKAGKVPIHKDWTIRARRNPPEAANTPALEHLANTGILCDGLRVIDADIDNASIAEAVEELVIEHLGAAPSRRRSNSSRFAMLYRAAEGEPRKLVLGGDGHTKDHACKIEVLGKGQQFVAYGGHVSGGTLSWTVEPLDMPRDQLPPVTETQIAAFLAAVAHVIGAEAPAPQKPKTMKGSNGATAPALARLVEALALVPAEIADDYDKWIRVGAALHHETGGSDEGMAAWAEWAAKSSKFDADETEERWNSFAEGGGDARVSAATIFHLATHYGWRPSDPTDDPGYLAALEADARAEAESEPTPPHPERDWPEPLDLFGGLLGAPELSAEHVPDAINDFVFDTAARFGTDPAAVALSAIVSCSAVISDEWEIQPKQHDYTWTENARVWGAIVGDPSVLKTPVLRACAKPVVKLEAEARKLHAQAMEEYQRVYAKWKKDGADEELKPKPPRLPRRLVENATIEALSEALRSDPDAKQVAPAGKVLLLQDELSEFLAGMDRYRAGGKGSADRGAYLRLYNGGPHTIDRINRGAFFIDNWSACLLGGIQPEPIQRIAKEADDDGLLQRFCYCVSDSPDSGVDRAPAANALKRYAELFPALAALYPPKMPGLEHAQHVVLHADARQFEAATRQVAQAAAALPDTSMRLRAALGKWPGLFARLALIFHLIETADARAAGTQPPPLLTIVSAPTAEKVASYMRDILLPHLWRAENIMFSSVQTNHTKWVAGLILSKRLERIAMRDIIQAYGALRAPEMAAERDSVMGSLELMGWVEPEPTRNAARGTTAWAVNHRVHELFADKADSERTRREAVKAAFSERAAESRATGHRG